MKYHRNQDQRKKGNPKRFMANKIRRKYLRLSQILKKCKLDQVKEIESKNIFEYPTTVKLMVQSNVSGGFCMPLPTTFCRQYLPAKDTIMILETEAGEQYKAKYLPRSLILSGGWLRFAKEMNLKVGDIAVFHLVSATKFKMHFIRENSASKISLKQTLSSKTDNTQVIVYRRREHQTAGYYNMCSARLNFMNPKDSMFSIEKMLFSEITSFADFKSVLQKLLQNQKLPYNILHNYYELCNSQNAFLHANLFKGIYPKFNNQIIIEAIRRIISDSVIIANALRTCTLSTFLQKHASWEKALNTYEALGLNAGFLQVRLHRLKNFTLTSQGAVYWNRYQEASVERSRVEIEAQKLKSILALLQTKTSQLEPRKEKNSGTHSWLVVANAEIRNLEVSVCELCKFLVQYDAHIETLKLKAEPHEIQFQAETSAPW
ncbi:B3 domain-containing protein Os01g0234100-like isoform X2 [Amaranthus tricolor]|uniref:B3 domain-containing protein Os01g0234100-like isoform X2 n=1 Tax=Amaranthus tricolor TaxID=29722 RepID=UPI002588ADEE|nr:B3 domain-containing protein Os01g0234100-like isoform X2 [Amaranthus tricolor]